MKNALSTDAFLFAMKILLFFTIGFYTFVHFYQHTYIFSLSQLHQQATSGPSQSITVWRPFARIKFNADLIFKIIKTSIYCTERL